MKFVIKIYKSENYLELTITDLCILKKDSVFTNCVFEKNIIFQECIFKERDGLFFLIQILPIVNF